jgi:hypothetical protein
MNMSARAPVLGGEPSLISFADESERLLIRRAQEGDRAARDELQRRYHGWRLKHCREFSRSNRLPKRGSHRPFLDWSELVTTAWLAFCEAIDRFDCTKNNGFEAYARKWVAGALRRLGRSQYDLGILDESNATRWLRSRWHEDIDPEEVVKAVGGNVLDAQRAIWREGARQGEAAPFHVPYSVTGEGGCEEFGSPAFVVDDYSPVATVYKPLNDADWEDYCRRRADANAQLRPGLKAQSFSAPLKRITKQRYEADQRAAHAFGDPTRIRLVPKNGRWKFARVSLTAKDRKEVLFRIGVGERLLYPIIGGWRPARWSGEDGRKQKADRGSHHAPGRVLPDLTQEPTNVVTFAQFSAHWHRRFKKFKRGYSETAAVKFKNGNTYKIVRQRGGPGRRVELTPEVCAAALDSSASVARRDEWKEWLRGKRSKPDINDRPVFDQAPIMRAERVDPDEEGNGDENRD